MTVLRKRVHHDGVEVQDDGALEVIAARITTNVRALEGALIRVVAYHSLTHRAITAQLAEEVLDGSTPAPRSPAGAARPPASRSRTPPASSSASLADELLSSARSARVAWPRQVAMYLTREHTSHSLPAIGAAFGGRNHTTVLHACKRTLQRLAADPDAFGHIRRCPNESMPTATTDRLRRSPWSGLCITFPHSPALCHVVAQMNNPYSFSVLVDVEEVVTP